MMKIERNVPVPKVGNQRYPFGEMKVGDSCFFKGGEHELVGNAARQYGYRHQMKFVARNVDGGIAWANSNEPPSPGN